MTLTIPSSLSADPLFDPSNLFEIIYEIDEKKRFKQLKEFIDQYSYYYDRFIFIYSQEDMRFEKFIFKRSLAKGKEVRKQEYLKPLVYSDIYEGESPPPSSEGIFEFFEKDDRLIQQVGLMDNQAFSFFSKTSLKSKPTCVVLVNLDRLCYRTSTLLRFYSSLLPYFSPSWGYLCLTKNQRSLPFYHWLALRSRKTVTINGKL